MGLPLNALTNALKEFGVNVWGDNLTK